MGNSHGYSALGAGRSSHRQANNCPWAPPNRELRIREYLTEPEVERLIEAAKDNRRGHRDSTMILVCFRHGLRAAELVELRRDQVDLSGASLHVRRVKRGTERSSAARAGVARTSSAPARKRDLAVCVRLRAGLMNGCG
jgi:integrase